MFRSLAHQFLPGSAWSSMAGALSELSQQQIRGFASGRRITVMRRAAKKAAGTKRQGHYEYKQSPVKSWSIFSGDLVEVKYGQETGQQARVTRVDRMYGHVFLDGLRIEYDVVKRASSLAQPRMDRVQKPFNYDHVMLVDPQTKKGTEVRWKVLENGKRERYSKESGTLIPRPAPSKTRRPYTPSAVATSREDAKRVTYEKHPRFLKVE